MDELELPNPLSSTRRMTVFDPWTNPLSREGFLRSRAQLEI